MKKFDKTKAINKMEIYDERIDKAKECLEKLEKRRNIWVSESVQSAMKANEISLNEFFEMLEKRKKELESKPLAQTLHKSNETHKPNNEYNGGNNT